MKNLSHKSFLAVFFLLLIFQLSCTQPETDPSGDVSIIKHKLKEFGTYDELYLTIQSSKQYPLDCEATMRIYSSESDEVKEDIMFPLGIIRGLNTKTLDFPLWFGMGNEDYTIHLNCTRADNHSAGARGPAFNITLLKLAAKEKDCVLAGPAAQGLCDLVLSSNYLECIEGDDPDGAVFCLAFLSKNSLLCDMGSSFSKSKCLAFSEKNPYFCSLYEDQSMLELCYLDFAVNNNQFAICDYIKDPEKKDSCISVKSRNPELCIPIKDIAAKELCMISLAMMVRDSSLCDNLEGYLRQNCLLSIR